MAGLQARILEALSTKGYSPVKTKVLAQRLGLTKANLAELRQALRSLEKKGRIEFGRNHTLRLVGPHGTVIGIFRRGSDGDGYVRPKTGPEIRIREHDSQDAATGDEVMVRLTRKPAHGGKAAGAIVRILERATHQFVGAYFERDGEAGVRVDGTVFSHSISVGDPGAKGARPGDVVVFEMVQFPAAGERGEGVITEILGPRGKPGVDTLSVIRAFGLPDEFPPDVLAEAREVATLFDEEDLAGREDFTGELTITVDPVTARDFDDAVALTRDQKSGHWLLSVHIADVSHFAPVGGSLDREARKRGTSVYLPQRVLPMFPELISNGLASLQQGKVRYVKSALIEFNAAGQRISARFANGAIRNKRRFTYEEVSAILAKHPLPDQDPKRGHAEKEPKSRHRRDGMVHTTPNQHAEADVQHAAPPGEEIVAMLLKMRELALILRARRRKRGALELDMPEAELEFDDDGRVIGAHFASHDISHQIIEEFMLAANEAVAEHLGQLDLAFLRRVHPAPDPTKLQRFAEFARLLGYRIDLDRDRFALQRVLEESAPNPEKFAVHFALLRSLKQAIYSPKDEGHYALASQDYCHFTSPIRRYPDLTVHRLLGRWLRTHRASSDEAELEVLGEHCSRTERRAETAERELIKLKLLIYMSNRLGEKMPAVITGVADYGFFAQAEQFPVEGLVHISSLTDDYYSYDEDSHTLHGRRTRRRFRLGDRVRVEVARVDVNRRQMDFRVVK